MKTTRRTFFLGGAALAALPSFSITSPAAGRKLRLGLIGCGGRMKALLTNAIDEEIVAMVDPDPAAFEKHFKLLKAYGHGDAVAKIKLFSDYHDMLDRMSGELDAVLIASTNHHHAPAAILAMQKGLHVYVEKPMASTIDEATFHIIIVDTRRHNEGVLVRSDHVAQIFRSKLDNGICLSGY